MRIGKGATRRLTIYAFDPSVSQHVILVKELASRRSARESRGGAADERQCLSPLLGSTHTDMKRARGPMAVHEQQRKSAANRTDTFDRVPHFPNPFTPHCSTRNVPARVRLLPRPLESERIALRGEATHNDQNAPRPSRGGRATSRELAVVLAQSSDGVGARTDVSPPTALVSQEVDAPRRILLLLLSLVVDERVAVSLVLQPHLTD